MPRLIHAFIGFLTILLIAAAPGHAARIGVASVVKNQVNGSVAGSINVGTGISQNEVIRTGAESSTQLLFRDETSLTIGANARVTLDRFVYNPNRRTGDVVVNVVQGTFRLISGSAMPGSYVIKTPVATIGLRGTVVEGFMNAGSLLLVVVEGSVVATSIDGTSVTVSAGQHIIISSAGVITGPLPWTGRTLDIESGQEFVIDTENPNQDMRDQFNDALDSRDIDITFPPADTRGGGKGIGITSDARLKRDIRHLATLEEGARLYAFKYLWSDLEFVGVMAQDLLRDPAMAKAVVRLENGYLGVRYDMLGLKLVTYDQWKRDGMSSVIQTGQAHMYKASTKAREAE